jgi:hypothetical protein
MATFVCTVIARHIGEVRKSGALKLGKRRASYGLFWIGSKSLQEGAGDSLMRSGLVGAETRCRYSRSASPPRLVST